MWYNYAMEYYSTLKRKEILIEAVTRMEYEDTLSEISQSPKDKYRVIPRV